MKLREELQNELDTAALINRRKHLINMLYALLDNVTFSNTGLHTKYFICKSFAFGSC